MNTNKYEYDEIRKGKYFVNSVITARPCKKKDYDGPGSPMLKDHEILIKIFLLFLSNLILYPIFIFVIHKVII